MSETTPGPWKRCGGTTPHYIAICDSGYRYIVFGMADKLTDTEHGKPIDAPSVSEQFANARLIAAAPDLLAACEALPDFDIDSPDAADFKDNAEAFMRAMRLARAAIAKAKGEV